ncbi:ECF RNA polymerase sigma-E factor [Aquisphaera giovannonii]|uniref:ECF RNA polymerase sigma-E factor n=1 Tax=Aquisphaera giovannonii TaxID=406548 RepID=A0A5B9VVS4_9BACT|nr:sigma-70 family RNA polymerase sigma factor [Aquisphaera giovannonii]QEH31820.1 ECF RNA polymerase sigma-E factor [Aquisphaera giovannonii]
MAVPDPVPETLLEAARGLDATARGVLLERYRNYLRLMARSISDGPLRARLDPSDIVQEAFLKAHREFDGFAGRTEPELVAWLRQILVRTMADQAKHHRRQGRDPRRQQSLEAALDRSSAAIHRALTAPLTTPSSHLQRRERAVLLADALEKLPPDYREVFILRSLEHIPVEEIAARMGRSANAVYKLWFRAMASLKGELEGLS